MDGAIELGAVGLIGAAVCVAAYVYGYIWKPIGTRWLNILGLFCTVMALVLLSVDLRQGDTIGPPVNRFIAEGFLIVSALTQAASALRRRRGERRSRDRLADPPVFGTDRRA